MVEGRYRQVICPWQTPKEIRSAEKFCDRIWQRLTEDERREVFRLDGPPREWRPALKAG